MELDRRDLLLNSNSCISTNDTVKHVHSVSKKGCCKSFTDCDCIFNRFSYIRVIISGLISAFAISGIYSYLSNITSVEVAKNRQVTRFDPVEIIDGISCWPVAISNISCNVMASRMANMTSHNIDYQCNQYTQFNHSDSLYSDMLLFKLSIIALIFFSITYGLSAIVHDCTLIYYRNNISMLTFHPINKNDFHLHTKYISCWKFKIKPALSGSCKYFLYCCFPILLLIYGFYILFRFICFGMDACFMLFIYPFISPCWKIKRNKINAFSYVSSSWVGGSRFWMLTTTALMVYFAASAHIEKALEPLDSSLCRCSCRYVFRENDFYSFVGVTYIFILLNAKFVFSWFMESVHMQHYLYLIEYSLPIEIANSINNKDCAGDMMASKLSLVATDIDDNKMQLQAGLMKNVSDKIDHSAHINTDYENNNNNNGKVKNKIAFKWRVIMLVCVILSFLFIGVSIIFIGYFNEYQYSLLLRIILYAIGAVICIAVIVVAAIMRSYYKRKTH